MINTGIVSYLAGGILFLVLTLLLVTSWKGRLQGAVLVIAALVNALWAFLLAYEASYNSFSLVLIFIVEAVRYAAWLIFLLKLLGGGQGSFLSHVIVSVLTVLWICAAGIIFIPALSDMFGGIHGVFIPGMLLMSIAGLVLVEQIYRNTREDCRWAVKYLCLGVGGLFAYDLFLYSHGLLFQSIDLDLWNARGAMNALVVPLIAVAAARNPEWSLNVAVSRKVVFYATGLMGIGVYLLAMAIGGYYIRIYGGNWGALVQATFLLGAILILMVVLFSGQVRARLKVFLSKHFYNYKYDYREEWHRLIRTLSSPGEDIPLQERTIKAVAQIVESPGGAVWINQEGRDFVQVSSWNFAELSLAVESTGSPLLRHLEEKQWVIDIDEYRVEPGVYEGLTLPDWLELLQYAWLIIPLIYEERLLGFMILSRSRVPMVLTWEDYDLLKTVGSQVASYLAQYEADQKLAESRQFEAYNRLTAFIMHDLKNLILQQSLMLKNAAKHKNNAAFIETAFETVDNSVKRMKRLLEQLQQGESKGAVRGIELSAMLAEVVSNCSDKRPVPELKVLDKVMVRVERDRMALVVEHLIRNAQQASRQDSFVRIRLKSEGQNAIVEVSDNGCGMDERFIRDRLFRPFDTTKGSQGMGIGVFQSREFAREAGGNLIVSSMPNAGTTFRLILPGYTEQSQYLSD